MSDFNVVMAGDLGAQFTLDPATNKISIPLTVTKLPLYEYRDMWAEETGTVDTNSAEWAYGNGAEGFMGLPIDAGWEVVQMGYNADSHAANATVVIDLMSYNTPSNAAANTLASIALTSSTDGGGSTNNAYKIADVTPTAVPAGVVGFYTRGEGFDKSNARVYARLRRQVGEYVSDVSLGAPAPTGVAVPTLPDAGASLTAFNFQDQFNQLVLNIGNTTNTAINNWEALVSNAPYADIANLNGVATLETADNGDGTYNHLLTGAAPIPAFGNVTAQNSNGDGPSPAGSGSGLTLYSDAP